MTVTPALTGLWPAFQEQLTAAEPLLRAVAASEYTLFALVGIFMLEGAMLLYFAPSEGILPAANVLLDPSPLATLTLVGLAVVGATIGQCFLFVLTKRLGRERLLASRWFRVRDRTLARFERWFDRWGPLLVPLTNVLPLTRGMVTVPAGLAGMSDRRFLVLSALGTLAFEGILAGATLLLVRG